MVLQGHSVPVLARGKESYPLTSAYAMRQDSRWSVFVVSRKLDGNHDGHDFSDGCTPVTLRRPFAGAKKIALYKMAGDPRLTNREDLNICIRSQEILVESLAGGTFVVDQRTDGSPGGIPPGSIYLYVFQAF